MWLRRGGSAPGCGFACGDGCRFFLLGVPEQAGLRRMALELRRGQMGLALSRLHPGGAHWRWDRPHALRLWVREHSGGRDGFARGA